MGDSKLLSRWFFQHGLLSRSSRDSQKYLQQIAYLLFFKEARKMAQQDTIQNRERFQAALQDAAAKQAIPLDRLSWRDIPNRDASDLIVEAGGKKRVFTITTRDMGDDAQGRIGQL